MALEAGVPGSTAARGGDGGWLRRILFLLSAAMPVKGACIMSCSGAARSQLTQAQKINNIALMRLTIPGSKLNCVCLQHVLIFYEGCHV